MFGNILPTRMLGRERVYMAMMTRLRCNRRLWQVLTRPGYARPSERESEYEQDKQQEGRESTGHDAIHSSDG